MVLRDGCSERVQARVGKRHDLKTVRWYVLTPLLRVWHDVTRSALRKAWMPSFPGASVVGDVVRVFRPSYVEVRKVDGKMVNTKRPLLFNYVFIRSSVEEIFRMKRTLPCTIFFPGFFWGMTHFPYLSDDEMGNLRWVAESYSNELPVYVRTAAAC